LVYDDRVRALAVLLAVALFWPRLVVAQDLAEQEARARYQAGQVAYAGEHWQRAFDDFSAAFALVPRPELLYDMARCIEALGRPDEATIYYERFLVARPDTPERANIERAIVRLRAVVAAAIEASPPPPTHKPVTHRWWLWTAIVGGAAVVGLGVGLGVGLRPHSSGAFPAVTVP
jgi:outer membrane receptor for ferrienterochelin and colicins